MSPLPPRRFPGLLALGAILAAGCSAVATHAGPDAGPAGGGAAGFGGVGGGGGGGVSGGGAGGGGGEGGGGGGGGGVGGGGGGGVGGGGGGGGAFVDAGTPDAGWIDYGMGPFNCAGFSATFTLPPPPVADRTEVPGFGSGGIVVQPLAMPSHAAGTSRIQFYEFRGPPTARVMTLSDQPCDTGVGLAKSYGNQTTISFSVDNPGLPPTLRSGRTYYVTIVNLTGSGSDSCPPGGANNGICAGALEFSPAPDW